MNKRATAKVFMTGRSQAVRLPKAFRVEGDEVEIHREGTRIVLQPIQQTAEEWLAELDKYGDEPFMPEGRQQPPMPPVRSWDD